MYWQYVAEYAVATTEALRGVYGGHDYGLSSAPGFNETALFRLHMNGPSQNSFDFGDSDGALDNSAAGYFMGYSALPSSSQQLRSLCAYEGRRLAKIVGGYHDQDYNYDQDYNQGSSHNQDSGHGQDHGQGQGHTGGAAVYKLKYNCGAVIKDSAIAIGNGTTPLGEISCARLLIDYSAAGSDAEIQALPTARVFKLSAFGWEGRNALGFFRSAWSVESEGALGKHAYLAFKAANGVPNHNDLDGGTFVFEAGGQRWGMDMSADSYQLKNYFTQSLRYRYGYYRKSTAGHNTLTFNNNGVIGASQAGSDQDPGMTGRTEITLFKGHTTTGSTDGTGSTGDTAPGTSSPAYSIVDLTAAYNRQNSTRVQRGFAFAATYAHLFVVDEFDFAPGAAVRNVTWSMHTMASIKLHAGSAGSAVLSLGGASLHATVLEPKGAVFSAVDVDLQPPYNPSPGVHKLMVALPMHTAALARHGTAFAPPVSRIVVRLSVDLPSNTTMPNALAMWKTHGPFH